MGDLAARTSAAADKLRDMMESLAITDKSSPQNTRKRKRTVASKLIKGVWNQKEVSRLRSELHELQQTMILRLGAIQKYRRDF